VYAVRLVTKVQIVGHWKSTRTNDLEETTIKMTVTEIISSTAIVTIVTKMAIKKLTAEPSSGITPTMSKKNMHLYRQSIQKNKR